MLFKSFIKYLKVLKYRFISEPPVKITLPGLNIATVNLFAVSEIFVQAEKTAKGRYEAPPVNMEFPSFFELWQQKFAVLRSILVGFFCGILPGIGATLAAFMGYGEAVRWSKKKDSFGKGNIEGVISSETANNAATGAAMIPLLALGLPGGALTAMMVAVFL